jgi:hypothetical protein
MGIWRRAGFDGRFSVPLVPELWVFRTCDARDSPLCGDDTSWVYYPVSSTRALSKAKPARP